MNRVKHLHSTKSGRITFNIKSHEQYHYNNAWKQIIYEIPGVRPRPKDERRYSAGELTMLGL